MRLLIFCLLLLCGSPAFAEPPLRVAVDAPYPPFAYYDSATGKLTGFDVDMAEALCRQIKRQCTVRAVPFDEIIPEIVAGRVDLGVAGMVKTPEREKSVIFTNKYFRTNTIFIEIAGTNQGKEFKGKRIGVQSGTNLEAYLNEKYASTNTILPMKNTEDIFNAIKVKEIDLGFVDGLPAFSFLRSEEGSLFEMTGEPVTIDEGSCIALHPSMSRLRDALNQAILDLRKSGEYQSINRKYFDISVY